MLFQLFRACLRCAHVEYHACFLLPLWWWWFAGRCVFTHCSVWSPVPVSSLEMAGGGHGEAKPDVSVLDMVFVLPDPGGPPLASHSLFSFQDGSAGSGAILLHGPCAFLSCCSGVVLPSARTLFLPQNRLFLGATLARLALILLRVWLYSRPACSSRRLDVCEQEVSL